MRARSPPLTSVPKSGVVAVAVQSSAALRNVVQSSAVLRNVVRSSAVLRNVVQSSAALRRALLLGVFLVGVAVASGGCGGRRTERATAPLGIAEPATRTPPQEPGPGPSIRAESPRETVVAVTDRETLARLEAHGLSFGARLASLAADVAPHAPSEVTASLPRAFRAIAREIQSELGAITRSDPAAGVDVGRFAHRLFDARFLASEEARFELVGVTNRIDRVPFDARHCGETRLVYRLSYERRIDGEVVRSRLPMTVALEYRGARRDPSVPTEMACREAAQSWQITSVDDVATRLLAGPLSGELLDRAHLRQLGLNVQIVRWPSTVRPDLAGHAEYLLLAFEWSEAEDAFVPRPLENTPDVARLRADAALRRELVSWISENLAAIDAGTATMPERFSARRARSVTPHGLARRENRPFRGLFEPTEFATGLVEAAALEHVKSPEGLLRRLDDASCQGCHESRSVAGFHWLGSDAVGAAPGNALVTPFSAHTGDELARRAAVVDALARGERADFSRPSAERGSASGHGAHCGLGDPSFASWTCAEGFTCQPYDAPRQERNLVGTCLSALPTVGDPCEYGGVEPALDPRRDRVGAMARLGCGASLACSTNEVGFPGGMCSGRCGGGGADARCGPIAILAPFNDCLARGEAFPRCLANHVRPASLRACSPETPCRDDYVCTRADPEAPEQGVCLPPYFLFQLRVDGHSPAR